MGVWSVPGAWCLSSAKRFVFMVTCNEWSVPGEPGTYLSRDTYIINPQPHFHTFTEFHSCQILSPSIRTIKEHSWWGHIKHVVRTIEISHAACNFDECRWNPRSDSWRFLFIVQIENGGLICPMCARNPSEPRYLHDEMRVWSVPYAQLLNRNHYWQIFWLFVICLLYTSDAADE